MRTAIDIGGTFTDLVYLDEATGQIGLKKTSTTPAHFEEGVMTAVKEAELHNVLFLAHGTTVIINTLTERKGARTALITTRGFRDVLEIQRANRPDLYNLLFTKPKPFVPRQLRLEVTERVSYKGEILTPLVEGDVRAAVAEARRQGVEAIAICFLHSYANPVHEQRAVDIVREEWPDSDITASHELTNEWREFPRTSTAVLDAYVKPVARRYLDALSIRLDEVGIGKQARYAMQSNGGVSRFETASRTPIKLVESGPVGGIIGAAMIGKLIEEPNCITLDIGGTTAKSSLVEQSTVKLTSDYFIERTPTTAGYPLRVPVVDIIEIGAGGGSIAWLDPAGALKVGPRSAGAEPGPAAYGRGGTEPTVTDANIIVGRINPDYFLGGSIALDIKLAREAVATIARPLGVSIEDAALGIIRIANANMVHLLKLVSVRQGRDPRDFAMIAFGGGGSMHASSLARDMHMPRVIIPLAPAHFSAWGMLVSDLRHDLVQTKLMRTAQIALRDFNAAWIELEGKMRSVFADEGVEATNLFFVRSADMRYLGQEHTVNVPVANGNLGEEQCSQIEGKFHELHEQLYTFRQQSPTEIVNLHLVGFGPVRKPELQKITVNTNTQQALKGTRLVDFDDLGRYETRIYERGLLGACAELEGPAVIEEAAASTLLLPKQKLHVDPVGNLIIETGI
ncbi:5-oxoprolinase [Reticulibacter mediterranei]|uniref:5-oxoprolinase n=1 Tax=Reticulibacter mediterranei TaxID=2778369 RepID=A0A8J3IH25_9CHLR|nr:hydantoinase/oxoprolinase family protein [Reticulibacter mediterranei]GHO90600.1 5-oxoprolinase [Reticulibacter mediterranei]